MNGVAGDRAKRARRRLADAVIHADRRLADTGPRGAFEAADQDVGLAPVRTARAQFERGALADKFAARLVVGRA